MPTHTQHRLYISTLNGDGEMGKGILILLILLAAISIDPGFGSAQSNNPLLVRNPTLSNTHIVFVYAGDLWIVPRDGGEASRLTNGVGMETNLIVAPDGTP